VSSPGGKERKSGIVALMTDKTLIIREPAIRRLRARDLPHIPATCGEVMQTLIPQCWSANAADRPSFEEVFALFAEHRFDIVSDADPGAMPRFCREVLAWETAWPSGVAG
jgi:hypothetical protein